jgi:hypothetical protein
MAQFWVDKVSGNCILICNTCKGETDKGCPPIKGQDDSSGTFCCAGCQRKQSAEAMTEEIEPMVIRGAMTSVLKARR